MLKTFSLFSLVSKSNIDIDIVTVTRMTNKNTTKKQINEIQDTCAIEVIYCEFCFQTHPMEVTVFHTSPCLQHVLSPFSCTETQKHVSRKYTGFTGQSLELM